MTDRFESPGRGGRALGARLAGLVALLATPLLALPASGGPSPGALRSAAAGPAILTGTLKAAVILVKYADTGEDPYPASILQTRLFDGPYAPLTLAEYYEEVSYGHFSVDGRVFGWVQLPEAGVYYEGGTGCLGTCPAAHVPEMVRTALDSCDATVDFGEFDSDGPDGIPNSGDDDGIVDVAAVVYPESGPTCGGAAAGNILPRMRSFSDLGQAPWVSDDAAAGGGTILVDRYTVQTGLTCDGDPDGIGGFAHEFGHVLGLRDLYDGNGGSAGIGFWGLMGTGRFLTAAGNLPAHMMAWTKTELGWLEPVRVGTAPVDVSIPAVETSPVAYRLDVMHERWRRSSDCPAGTGAAMRCGLTADEAAARHWGGGAGYGNGWVERVSREFHYDGAGPVTLAYDYAVDAEDGWDFVVGVIETAASRDTFIDHTGTATGTAVRDLSPWLTVPGDYTVSFVFVSDGAWSDEDYDGAAFLQNSVCAPFAFDNVVLTGGGENYATGFDEREDGWWCDMEDPSEYFLVELRLPTGSDAAIPGPGLLVWHIDQDVSESLFGNSGGSSGLLPHGSALVQADGRGDLETLANYADDGDPYPGSTGNLVFDSGSVPDSRGYGGASSHAALAVLGAVGDPTPVRLQGGWPPPTWSSHFPDSAAAESTVVVHVFGRGFVHGVDARLERDLTVVPAETVTWVGKDYVIATFDIPATFRGDADLVLTNPGGGTVSVPAALTVTGDTTGTGAPPVPPAFVLRRGVPNPFRESTTVAFALPESADVELTVHDVSGRVVRRMAPGRFSAGEGAIDWDGRDDRGRRVPPGTYYVRVVAGGNSAGTRVTVMR